MQGIPSQKERVPVEQWRSHPQPDYNSSAPHILILGDSGDRFLLLDWCQRVRGLIPQWGLPKFPANLSGTPDGVEAEHRYMYFMVCDGPTASLAMRIIPGVHPTGPYHKHGALVGESSRDASWVARTPETLALFKEYFGRAPDLVVFHSNFWDIARVSWGGKRAGQLTHGLSEGWLQGWIANFTAWAQLLRDSVPQNTLLVTHTAAPPQADEKGIAVSRQLGSKLVVAQINAATRAVATSLDIQLVDCEMHVAGLTATQALRDAHHPAPWLQMEWLNMYLNLLQASTYNRQ